MTIEPLAREVGAVGKLLHKLNDKQWHAPTRCAPLSVFELAAHIYRGGVRVNDMLDAEPVDDEPEKDRVTYWQMDLVAIAPEVVERARTVAADLGTAKALVQAWDEQWGKALRRSRTTDLSVVRPTPFGLMQVGEYLATRCVEILVHHMDLDDAIGKDVHPDPACLVIVADILRGLLGTDLRPTGMDDVRFVFTGTGRAPLTDEERSTLGPLAENFPLLS